MTGTSPQPMTNEHALVVMTADGVWSWRYRGDGLELRSAETYASAVEAERAAREAYPGIPVAVGKPPPRGGSSPHGRGRVLRGLSMLTLGKRLLRETSSLLGEERELAKTEMRETARYAGITVASVCAAAFFGLLAAGALTACIILALSHAMAAWLAALIVAIAYVVSAAALAVIGIRSAKRAKPVMPRTTETLKETIGWARHQMRSDGRSRSHASG